MARLTAFNSRSADLLSDAEFKKEFGISKEDWMFVHEAERHIKDNGIHFYEPFPKQALFHQAPQPYRLFHGSNRSGKTVSGSAEAIWYALGCHPYKQVDVPNEGWVVSKDYNVQKEAAQKLIMDLLPRSEIRKVSHVKAGIIESIELKKGSLITFKSCDSGVDRFAGAAKRWIWFDEEPPKDIWNECLARIGAGMPLDIWMTMTPIFEDNKGRRIGMSWTYKDLYMKKDPERIFTIGVALDDNPFLADWQKEEQKKKFFGAEYDIRIKGEFKLLSGSMVFDPDAVQFYFDRSDEPICAGFLVYNRSKVEFQDSESGSLRLWEKPVRTGKYFIGADVGLGVGGDPSCAIVFDRELNQVAELHGQIPPDIFAREIEKLAIYFNNAWVCVEANSFGQATLNELKKTYFRLYYKYQTDERNDTKTRKLGWWTDTKSKPILISDFGKTLREKVLDLRSKELIEELMTYVIDESTSANAEIGCRDDRVIAAMLTYQCWKRFHNFNEMQKVDNYVPVNAVGGY